MDRQTNSQYVNLFDTIAAVSTPVGEGGIGVIRLSGLQAVPLALKIFRRRNGAVLDNPKPFQLYYGVIVDPQCNEIIDEVLLSTMRAPRSYTREDMAEISAHGGPLPLQAILQLLCNAGARLAQPGEFTQRAFLNGRIDLTQAEAVLDTISARTGAGLRAAQRHLQGEIGLQVQTLRNRLIGLLSSIEAAIDYAEEDLSLLPLEEVRRQLYEVRAQLCALITSHTRGRLLRQGAQTVIIGRPNTGKSSLLNTLLGETRAIVTPVPGTTRDVIEEQIDLAGVPLRLLDTAGIRHTDDLVESLGVARSRAALESADLLLLVLDRAVPLTDEDHHLLRQLHGRPAVIILNKADLPACVDAETLINASESPVAVLSTLTGEGLDDLHSAISALLLGGGVATETPMLANMRQRDAAAQAAASLDEALDTLDAGGSEELLAVDILAATEALAEITGEAVRDQVIADLFARFCVGK